MHQTTLRFGADLWQTLEREAAAAGTSVAQYVREAAVARLAYDAARRGDPEFEAAVQAGKAPARMDDPPPLAAARDAARRAEGERDSSTALWHQSRLARERARRLREEASKRRRLR
jgi:hypothetical protein